MRSRKSWRPTARIDLDPLRKRSADRLRRTELEGRLHPGRRRELGDGAESIDGAVPIGVEAHGVDPVRTELSHHRDVSGQVTHVGVLADHHAFTQGDRHPSVVQRRQRLPPQLTVDP